MYFRSQEKKSVCADVIPYFEDGEFRLFYLKDYRDIANYGEGCPWCLLKTKDLVNYTDYGPVLLRGSEDEQDLYVFTGCTTKFNDEYYVFYTGHNPHLRRKGLPEQKILLAKGKTLEELHKVKDFVFEAPDWMEMHDFRDPFVFFDDETGKYCMLLAGRVKSDLPSDMRGTTMMAYSDDLMHWDVSREPFYAPREYFTHECPDLFKMGGWWYLVFSEFTDKICTTYRMSKSIRGPWITPKVNTFDGHAFYAAKSVSDGKRRILFGWNPIKNDEQDDKPWQWGGTIIAHEIVQEKDGTLYVRCPDEVSAAYSKQTKITQSMTMGSVKRDANGVTIGENGSKSLVMFDEMPQNCKITMKFVATDNIGDFGIILRESNGFANRYEVRFEPAHNRICFDKQPRKNNCEHVNIDVERYCPIEKGKENTITLIVEGSVLEVYVNDRVAMGARMFDFANGRWGLYAKDTTVKFYDLSLCE